MRSLLTYKTISEDKFDLKFNGNTLVEVEMDKVEVRILVDSINEFINDFSEGGNIIEVKLSGDGIGLIVDIWQDFRYEVLIDTAIFYLEDFVVI